MALVLLSQSIRSLCRYCVILAALIGYGTAFAQPSVDQIRKDIGASDALTFRCTSSGTRQWNKDLGNWEYLRGVEVVRKSSIPGVNLLVVGDAVYQQQSASHYSYWKFRVLSNSYEGMPNPSEQDVLGVVSQHWDEFYGFLFSQTLHIVTAPHLETNPEWNWDTPKTLDCTLGSVLEMIWQGNHIAQVEQKFRVRLFRDDRNSPWTRFIVTSRDDQKVISQKEVSFDRIRELQKQSLEFTLNEQLAASAAAALPAVDVPDFQSVRELAIFVHHIMRNSDEKQFRAALLKLLSPRFFVEHSTTQLNAYGEQQLKEWSNAVYGGSILYRDEYCEQFAEHPLNSQKVQYIPACLKNLASMVSVDRFTVGYKEGVAQTALRITDMNVALRTDDDAKSFLQSFSSHKSLCPNDD